jgi:hypothetical protein
MAKGKEFGGWYRTEKHVKTLSQCDCVFEVPVRVVFAVG